MALRAVIVQAKALIGPEVDDRELLASRRRCLVAVNKAS
jgi:hypothetical protein